MQLDLSRFSPAERSTLQLRVLYEGAGYRKFRCSHFEEYSLYQQNERFLSDSQVITFTDLDGKLRAIKPDVTLSIAKNAQPPFVFYLFQQLLFFFLLQFLEFYL